MGVIRCIPASLQVSLEVKPEGQGRTWRSEVKDSRSVINNRRSGHCCRQVRTGSDSRGPAEEKRRWGGWGSGDMVGSELPLCVLDATI